MAELELESFSAECLAENLMAEADSEDRNAAVHEFFDFTNNVGKGGWIAGTVRKEDAGGFVFHCLRGGRTSGNDLHFEPTLGQPGENVVFHPEVIGTDGNIRGASGKPNVPRI